MIKNYTLFKFHGKVLLFPTPLVSVDLIDAIEQLSNTENGNTVKWTNEQQKAFIEAYCHPATITLL